MRRRRSGGRPPSGLTDATLVSSAWATSNPRGATFVGVVEAAPVVVERLTEASEAAAADINGLLPQLKPSWDPVTRATLADVLSSPTRVYVARVGGTIVGLTLLVPHRHFGGLRHHLEDVVVDAAHRRRGIARRLLDAAMADAPPQTVSFDLRSHRSREAAHRLYVGLGFVPSDTTVFRRRTP
jgi:ribosomal protein S18 acetylase RimI-like enzyme